MWKRTLVFILILTCIISGCGKKKKGDDASAGTADTGTTAAAAEEPQENGDRAQIAEAVGKDPSDRAVDNILKNLEQAGVGHVARAYMSDEDGKEFLYVLSENLVEYNVVLTGNGTVDSIQNMDTEEWVIKSER